MKCPFCGSIESNVIDSRPLDNFVVIRRRRECDKCKKRFTTYERMEIKQIVVIKKSNKRENFDRNKLMRGILVACRKRAIPMDKIEAIVASLESDLMQQPNNEVSVKYIGDKVMEELKALDEVAYIRFVSVYKDFDSLDMFVNEITSIKK